MWTVRGHRVDRIDKRIANLVDVLASGERSDAISKALQDMESHRAMEQKQIEALNDVATQPIRLPTPDEVMARVLDIEARMDQDPIAAREEVRRYFDGGRIQLEVNAHDQYVARWALLPLVLLADTYKNAPGVSGGGASSCQATFVVAGARSPNILRLEFGLKASFDGTRCRLPAPQNMAQDLRVAPPSWRPLLRHHGRGPKLLLQRRARTAGA